MRERRLVFGEAADLYDRHRPVYPDALIDDVIALAALDGSRAVLEVGAGTGKATVMFAARGIPVVAVEPSAEMAAIARQNLSAYPAIEIEQADFERWDAQGRQFPLLFSAQAWHWVQPEAGYPKARQVLLPRGVLAAFWNRVAWDRWELREALRVAYQQAAPELSAEGPMHPATLSPEADDAWEEALAGAEGFTEASTRHYEWAQDYSTRDYLGLLATISDVRLLDDASRARLFDAVSAVIDAHGGRARVPMRTQLCLARAKAV